MGELGVEDTSILITEFEADYFGTEDDPPASPRSSTTPRVWPACTGFAPTARPSWRPHSRRGPPSRLVPEFAAFDRVLRNAAAVEGFALVPAVGAAPS